MHLLLWMSRLISFVLASPGFKEQEGSKNFQTENVCPAKFEPPTFCPVQLLTAGDIHFYFEFFAPFPFLIARQNTNESSMTFIQSNRPRVRFSEVGQKLRLGSQNFWYQQKGLVTRNTPV